MTRIFLAAGVAALAIAAPAASAPGGKGGGHEHSQKARGGGEAKAQARGGGQAKAQARHADRVRGSGAIRIASDRGHGPDKRVEQRARHKEVRAARVERPRDNRVERVREARRDQIERIRDVRADQMRDLRADRIREARRGEVQRLRDVRDLRADRFDDRVAVGYGVGGCPPGLAKKAVACMPPGQAKKLVGRSVRDLERVASLRRVPVRLQSIYADTPDYYYRYGDNGYVYRVNRADNLVSSLLPLFGLGYGIGQPFPVGYSAYGMPAAYQPFYPSTPYADYRYANGYVYQIDPYTGLIEDVDPALGYGYGFGQTMPLSYSAYNVPYDYRPFYQDTPDAYYRYAPGAIYQVDPQTSLITAVAALLSPGLSVGQPLPMGYSAYNVPYGYRSTYYDTPDAMYRYANGNIYRVDPATQLVTALVAAALT
jgi:hypothetical protein